MAKILIVDDHESFLKGACDLVNSMGHQCIRTTSVDEGLRLAGEYDPECFILDIRLDESNGGSFDGVDLFEKLKEDKTKRCRMIFASAHTDYDEDYLLRRGATTLIDKEEFHLAIPRALNEVFYPRLLLIEDNVGFASGVSAELRTRGIKCVSITNQAKMISHVKECDLATFDVVLTDAILNGKGNFHGWDVVSHVLLTYSEHSVFMFTEKDREQIELEIGRRFDDFQTRHQLLSAISRLSEEQVLDKEGDAWIDAIERACAKAKVS
jgi:DNA-binding response OmpR family regulator